MEIKANIVTVDESGPVVIGFADDDKQPVNYLLLQYDATEKGAGLHIEVNDQQRSGYNFVQRIRLTDSAMFIELNSAGMRALKAESEIKVFPTAQVSNWPSFKLKVMRLLDGLVPVV